MAAFPGPITDCALVEVGESATLKRMHSSSNLAPAGISSELSIAFVICVSRYTIWND